MENKTITITEEQFRNAVTKANEEWMSIGQEVENINPMTHVISSMQNMMFGVKLASILFNESEDKE
jgi:hypothetical protein